MNALYVDGGVIGRNPSSIGGTFAWRMVNDGEPGIMGSDTIPAQIMPNREVTNNQTEMLAMIEGLRRLPADWIGTVYSDSAVTLGRTFGNFRWKNIPEWMRVEFHAQKARLVNWGMIQHVQLDGHPTKAQLASGIGKGGNPVSIHNVWCDEACTSAGKLFLVAK